jgi:hypothetical protein
MQDTIVLAQEWTPELSSRADAPHGLVDLQAWRVVCGDDGGGESWRLLWLRRRRVGVA